jgi:hypothetical protein
MNGKTIPEAIFTKMDPRVFYRVADLAGETSFERPQVRYALRILSRGG